MKKLIKITRIILVILGLCTLPFIAMFLFTKFFLYSEQIVVINDTNARQSVSMISLDSDNNNPIKEEKQIKPNKVGVYTQTLFSMPICIAGMEFNSLKTPIEIKDQMNLVSQKLLFRTVRIYTFKLSEVSKLATKYPCLK